MLLPALASAKERAKRTACKSNMRQCIMAVHMYGNDFQDRVPSGRENVGNWHAIRVANRTFTNLVRYSGNSNILDCANFRWNTNVLKNFSPTYGYLIGYQYLGDAVPPGGLQYRWVSPTKLSQSGTNVILADSNHWADDGLICVPHRKSGGLYGNDSSYFYGNGGNPIRYGARGGNVGYLNGAVIWKRIADMQTNQASSYTYYWGLW